ncbi:uncharacterized protein LOC112515510 [Cynara cardunculus var. scolymus]|uniref:uncharacterized protein LOC112515510 n=1 Tax=Cynara cardunculus var. scolymus TaxID=59895 RepID=UPI000D630656|nr:uncharacterized protein LOC112515510 [Cynara cardunculus var. scolymus]
MDAFSTRYPPFQRSLYISSPPGNHHRFPNLQHHGGVACRLAMRFHNLQRITTALNLSHRNRIQLSLKSTIYLDLSFDFNSNSIMDGSGAKNEIRSGDGLSAVKDTKETEKLPEIPPPPEKPLPGDCCGSGCVRCVWDIYYEELEEYNKLCKGKSDATIGSKVS